MNAELQFHFLTTLLAQGSRFPTLRKPIDRTSKATREPSSSRMPFRTRPNVQALSSYIVKVFPITVATVLRGSATCLGQWKFILPGAGVHGASYSDDNRISSTRCNHNSMDYEHTRDVLCCSCNTFTIPPD